MIPGKLKIRNWYWFHEEILENFSERIPVKLGKNYEEILEKLKKYRKYFAWNFKGTFLRKLCEIFRTIFERTYEKLYGSVE